MTDEPTKAAIERACELLNENASEGGIPSRMIFDWRIGDARHSVPVQTLARHLDQVSETAKYGQAFIEQALASFVFDEPTADLAYKAEEGLRGLILTDPEPDVLAELLKVVGEADLSSGAFRLAKDDLADFVIGNSDTILAALSKDTSHDR